MHRLFPNHSTKSLWARVLLIFMHRRLDLPRNAVFQLNFFISCRIEEVT